MLNRLFTATLVALSFAAPGALAQTAAPTVSLTGPAENASYSAPASITLSATAAPGDASTSITQVEFYNGASFLGSSTAAPYSLTWPNVAAGSYTVTAKATDSAGSSATSGPVAVTVNAAPANQAQLYFIHTDHLTTPRVISDANKTSLWKWESDPFGSTPPNEKASGNNQTAFIFNPRFPGQYFDKETGLHYNYYRDYDPALGRYIESDPIGLRGGLNTYGYVEGDPLGRIDPTGEAGRMPGPGFGPRIWPGLPPGPGQDRFDRDLPREPKDYQERKNPIESLKDAIERIANRRQYKRMCEQKPPEGLDKCEKAWWEWNNAWACKNAREENTERWHNGVDDRHSPAMYDEINNKIKKARDDIDRYCKCQ